MVPKGVIEAHAAAEAGEHARQQAYYREAIAYGRRAWLSVRPDASPAALEAFLKGTRVESWGWQMVGAYDWAVLIARQGLDRALDLAPGSLLADWAEMRLLEVETTGEGDIASSLHRSWKLAQRLIGRPHRLQLRFVALYTALGSAAKLGRLATAAVMEREAEGTLRRAVGSPYEHAFRAQQALFAIRTGDFDVAQRRIDENLALKAGRRVGAPFTQAHLLLAAGERDAGVALLQEAVHEAAMVDQWQAIGSALRYMSPFIEPDAISVPAESEIPARVSFAAYN